MKIFAEDDRFLKLDLKRDEKGEITMCTILDAAEQRGYSRGVKNGISKRNAIYTILTTSFMLK